MNILGVGEFLGVNFNETEEADFLGAGERTILIVLALALADSTAMCLADPGDEHSSWESSRMISSFAFLRLIGNYSLFKQRSWL